MCNEGKKIERADEKESGEEAEKVRLIIKNEKQNHF